MERYYDIEETLLRSPMLRPLEISSQETAEHLSGEIFATVKFDMNTINSATNGSERWCEVMLLLSNCQSCIASTGNENDTLHIVINSSKTIESSRATATEFKLRVQSATNNYLDIALIGSAGPAGTRNINLRIQAIPLSDTNSFVHLQYSYDTQWLGRLAMQTYLQTSGRGKLGFTSENNENFRATYIGGARGVIERNTMRYFLGFECALLSNTQQVPERFSSMAKCWYEQVEKYPTQLHEIQRTEYLDMKAEEYRRQR